MRMDSQPLKNAGYLLVLLPQVLLVSGTHAGIPWFSVAFFFLVLPLVRKFVGNDLAPPCLKPSPALEMYFRAIPRLYCVCWAVVLAWTIWAAATIPMSLPMLMGFALGIWIVCSLNTAIAHELVHSDRGIDRKLGAVLDASVGYFHFPEHHVSHHARTGHYYDGDAAQPGTSIYAFVVNRYLRSLVLAFQNEALRLRQSERTWLSSRLVWRALIPVAIGSAFFLFAGPLGLAIYIFQIIGTAFSVQAITYLQHWGLSERDTPELADYGFSWEDGCWMQACVTLNHAYHGNHHLSLSRPYYKLTLKTGYLSLPGSYPVMFMVALVPPVFTAIMRSTLSQWIEAHQAHEATLHNEDCIGAVRMALRMGKSSLSR